MKTTETILYLGAGGIPAGICPCIIYYPPAVPNERRAVVARYIDPDTGDYRIIDGGFFLEMKPVEQRILFCLLNRKGTVAGKPNLGIDLTGLESMGDNFSTLLKFRIRDALSGIDEIVIKGIDITTTAGRASVALSYVDNSEPDKREGKILVDL